jgi:autotransporter-associated beta strand protein
MIRQLLSRAPSKPCRKQKGGREPRRRVAFYGLTRPEPLEGRHLLAGVVLPNLPAGSKYQIMFVTAAKRLAESADISTYNAYVTSEAGFSQSLPAATWRAWASTAMTNASDNAPTYPDVPIYNTRGQLIAANSSEFLFPIHRATRAFDQFGLSANRQVWTGSDYRGKGILNKTLGYGITQWADANNYTASPGWVSVDEDNSTGYARSMYAISSVITVPPVVPAAVGTVSVTSGNGAIRLAWQTPANDGRTAITDYVIQYRLASATSDSAWTVHSRSATTATMATVDWLTNGVAYVFRVAAMNSVGQGAFSPQSASCIPQEDAVYVATGQVLTETATYSGTQGRRKQGGGTLILDSISTNTGATIVENGEIVLRHRNALGNGSLDIQPNGKVTFGTGQDLVAVSSLTLASGGLLDIGQTGLYVYGDTTIASRVRDFLVAGRADGTWNGSSGIVGRLTGTVNTVGHMEESGQVTIRTAVAGDTNLDGVLDVLDVARIVSEARYDSGDSSTWQQGDFNYDGVLDILDVSAFISSRLYDKGNYRDAVSAAIDGQAILSLDATSWAFYEMAAAQSPPPKTKRLVIGQVDSRWTTTSLYGK